MFGFTVLSNEIDGAVSTTPDAGPGEATFRKRLNGLSVPRVVLAFGLAIALSLLVVFFADWAHLKAALPKFRAQPQWLAVLVAAYTGAFFLRAAAWRALVPRGSNVFRLFVAIQGALFANHILPFKLGEVARPMMAERSGLPLARAAATTAVARMLDLAALVAIAAVVGSLVSLAGGSATSK